MTSNAPALGSKRKKPSSTPSSSPATPSPMTSSYFSPPSSEGDKKDKENDEAQEKKNEKKEEDEGQGQGKAHTKTRRLGGSELQVPVLGQGGTSLGDLYVKLSNEEALATIRVAYELGITFFDTSPWYGVGLSEARFGLALHSLARDSFVLSTKVGRFLVPDTSATNGTKVGWIGGFHMGIKYDYSAEAFQRQLEDSLARMGLGYVESLVIHDLEPSVHMTETDDGAAQARVHLKVLQESGFAKLQQLRASGSIKAFGAGMNSDEAGEDKAKKRAWNKEFMSAVLGMGTYQTASKPGTALSARDPQRGVDFMLLANMWSLLNYEALEDGILDQCSSAGVSIVVGGPFSSGILATGADPKDGSVPYYNYLPADEEVRARCRRIEAVCRKAGVPLIAAALQFPFLHPAVSCVIPGGKNTKEVTSCVEMMNVSIPSSFWRELQTAGLLPQSLILAK